MKKSFILLMSMFAMLAAGTSLSAQEVTVVLQPGWNWIGYPYSESADLETVFVDFEPMPGDVIASFGGLSDYIEGLGWLGEVDEMKPGWGYMYYSSRTATVSMVLHAPTSSMVTTTEPTDINGTSAVVGSTVTIGEGNHVFARGVCWGTEEMPTVDGSHTSDEAVAGSQSVTLVGLSPVTTYYVRAYAVTDYGLAYGEEQSFTTESHDYVDLGLPSGLLWATCNVGADTPEGYGDYFAWGETQPKSTYNWSSYQYCNGSSTSNVKLTKYCGQSEYGYNGFTDNLTTLLPEDDAATANWGNNWRMPTQAEWQELLNNTTVTWTTQNGVYGRLFTASNGNSLFLPAAGYRNNGSVSSAGSSGYYWSSSLYTDNPNPRLAWNFYFSSGNYYMNGYGRYYGQSVRAVRHKNYEINVTAYPLAGGSVSGGGFYMDYTLCTLTATANGGFVFENWTENGVVVSTEATYTFTVNGNRNLVANFSHLYVDLGLPSGTLWATCNVGADTPEDYGDYFAWGETQPKSTYDWNTYQYCMGSNTTLTKYCQISDYGYNGFTDGLTTLEPSDDAATANWGADWRTPTYSECMELYNYTTHTWTTQNGVNGRLFTASNGNSLFLPAAGMSFNGPINNGSRGCYWARHVNSTVPSTAWYLYFLSSDCYRSTQSRDYGCSVRPVRSSGQK